MTHAVQYSASDGLATITLNRPDKANALTAADRAEIRRLCAAIVDDEGVRVVVIASAGEKVFSAGVALEELPEAKASAAAMEAFNADVGGTFAAIAALPCLTVARIQGVAAGGGLALACACDLRVASVKAGAFYPVLKNGVIPPDADPARLAAIVGQARARLLLIGGKRIDAAQALAMGLWDAVAEDLDAEIAALVAPALGARRLHIAGLKAQIAGCWPAQDRAAAYAALYDGAS